MPIRPPIPGETPIDDISGLKIKGVRTRKELNLVEAENIRKAVVMYLAKKPSRRSAPFDFSWSLKLHKVMFGDVWQWAGKTRTSDKNMGAPWEQVPALLYALLDDLAYWDKQATMDILEQAVLLHHRAVAIHPFENGNGRWARLLSNIWLKRQGRPVTEWPEVAVGQSSPVRDEYLNALRQADHGNYGPLLELHRRFTPGG